MPPPRTIPSLTLWWTRNRKGYWLLATGCGLWVDQSGTSTPSGHLWAYIFPGTWKLGPVTRIVLEARTLLQAWYAKCKRTSGVISVFLANFWLSRIEERSWICLKKFFWSDEATENDSQRFLAFYWVIPDWLKNSLNCWKSAWICSKKSCDFSMTSRFSFLIRGRSYVWWNDIESYFGLLAFKIWQE